MTENGRTIFDNNEDTLCAQPLREGIMVCVTGQRSCERLIMHGAKRSLVSRDNGANTADDSAPADLTEVISDGRAKILPLYIVHCVQTGQNFMNTPYEADAIEYLFTCAQVVGAELTILREDSVEDALARFARENNVGVIVMGAPGENGAGKGRFAMRLQDLLPDVEFDVLM